MKLAFKINYYDRIPLWVVGLHIAFAKWLADQHPIDHTIEVHLAPNISLPTNDGRRCWAYFCPGKPPTMMLACRRPTVNGRLPNRDLQIAFLLSNFAHEFVHYEQWRDSRPTNHRGLENRVDGIIKRFNKYVMEGP